MLIWRRNRGTAHRSISSLQWITFPSCSHSEHGLSWALCFQWSVIHSKWKCSRYSGISRWTLLPWQQGIPHIGCRYHIVLLSQCPTKSVCWSCFEHLTWTLSLENQLSRSDVYVSAKVGSHKGWINTWRKLRNGTDLTRKIEVEFSMEGKLHLDSACPPSDPKLRAGQGTLEWPTGFLKTCCIQQ